MEAPHHIAAGLILAVALTSSVRAQTADLSAAEPDAQLQQQPIVGLTATERLQFTELDARKLDQFSNQDLATFLSLRHKTAVATASPGTDLQLMARKSAGVKYRLFASRFDLAETDCVTFVERSLAIALGSDYASYYRICERLRHKDGVVDYKSRNFFTLTEWLPNNAWLLRDITPVLGQGKAAKPFTYVIRPKRFEDTVVNGRVHTNFLGADYSSPDKQVVSDVFIPRDRVQAILPELHPGDVCLMIREYHKKGMKPWYGCDHMGLIGEGPTIIHSGPPSVREEEVMSFLRKYRIVAGFKFLRIRTDAASRLTVELPKVTKQPPPPADQDVAVTELRELRTLQK